MKHRVPAFSINQSISEAEAEIDLQSPISKAEAEIDLKSISEAEAEIDLKSISYLRGKGRNRFAVDLRKLAKRLYISG